MRKAVLFGLLVALSFLAACGSEEPKEDAPTPPRVSVDANDQEVEVPMDTTTTEVAVVSDTLRAQEPTDSTTSETAKYDGSWFTIHYPADFTPSPTEPVDTFPNYIFVKTDEATFSAPDGSVEFFVYSPQWSGNPESYLNAADNEELVAEKEKTDRDNPYRVMKWITFKDKDGAYTRSVFSDQSESTHLVFGVKYSDKASYDKYSDSYQAFKKSLIQYAD